MYKRLFYLTSFVLVIALVASTANATRVPTGIACLVLSLPMMSRRLIMIVAKVAVAHMVVILPLMIGECG